MSPSFPSSEHTSYSIRLLPSLMSPAEEEPDPGETWSGPSFQDTAQPDPDSDPDSDADPDPDSDSDSAPAASLAPLALPRRPSAAPSHSLPLLRRPSAIPPPIPPRRPQRAKAPHPALLAPLPITCPAPAPRRAGVLFAATPARIAAVICGALMLVAATTVISYLCFSYLLRIL